MASFRRAEASEAPVLTDIAAAAEAYWGYDSDFMDSFRQSYRVTEEMIEHQPTYIVEDLDVRIGFYNLLLDGCVASLEYFYIAPSFIGKGYGKLLWEHMTAFCRNSGVSEITFVTSPQAVGFYARMGAVQIGETESLVMKNRRIPVLLYRVEK